VVGLAAKEEDLRTMSFKREGDSVLVVGETRPELAGSEFSSRFPASVSGVLDSPRVDAKQDLKTCGAVLRLVSSGLINAAHDCSSGGVAVALAEMAISGGLGAKVDLSAAPSTSPGPLWTAFSESHGRFIVTGPGAGAISDSLRAAGVPHGLVGEVGGEALSISSGRSSLASVPVSSMKSIWEGALPGLMD
jgi:phosphoribosylformylglycinamidine (FGAM) synthase-like enzyme